MNSIALGLSLLLLGAPISAQETKPADSMKDCPLHAQHMAQQSHHATMESHGDQAMGFPHDKTTHHFRLISDGGAIEVTANDPNDKTNTEAIRSHLSHIARDVWRRRLLSADVHPRHRSPRRNDDEADEVRDPLCLRRVACGRKSANPIPGPDCGGVHPRLPPLSDYGTSDGGFG